MPVGLPGAPKGLKSDLHSRQRIQDLIRRGQIDLIHAHNGRSALVAASAGAGRRIPMVMSQHFLNPARTTRRGFKGVVSKLVHAWLEKRIARHVAISEAVKQASINFHVAPAAKLSVVLNGIRPPQVAATASSWREEAWAADVRDQPFVFCAARAEPEKDLPTLVLALSQLKARHVAVPCVMAGGGRDLNALREQIDQYQLSDSVKLLGFRQDVAQLLHACSVFVLPAPAEPFGLVLLEAMALGKPVIACDAGGPREIVEHGVTGLLVSPGNPTATSEAIEQLTGDKARAAVMGTAGQKRYQARFTAKVMAERMLEVYTQVLREWHGIKR